MAHLWPGITPMNVWDMTYGDWLLFAGEADAWVDAQKQQQQTNRKVRR